MNHSSKKMDRHLKNCKSSLTLSWRFSEERNYSAKMSRFSFEGERPLICRNEDMYI